MGKRNMGMACGQIWTPEKTHTLHSSKPYSGGEREEWTTVMRENGTSVRVASH